jgi:hypothetical protein
MATNLTVSIAGLMVECEALAEKIKAFRESFPAGYEPAPDLKANLTLAQRSAEGAVDKLVRILGNLS